MFRSWFQRQVPPPTRPGPRRRPGPAASFRPRLECLEDRNLLSIAALVGDLFGNPQPATHLFLFAPETAHQGQPAGLEVVALGASNLPATDYSGTVHFTSTDGSATLPADFTFQPGDYGQHFFHVTLATLGNQTVTATDTTTSSITGSITLNVGTPDVATHFLVVAPPQVPAGTAAPVLVVALDAANHPVPGYTGTVHFTSTDATVSLPADYAFTAGDHGHHLFQVTVPATGTPTLTVTDTTTSSLTGSVTLTVTPPDVATHFLVVAPRHARAGHPTHVLVVALDASNLPVLNYTGTVHFTSTDGKATLPADFTFSAGDYGSHVFQVTFGTAGSDTLTVADKATASVTGSASVDVRAASGSSAQGQSGLGGLHLPGLGHILSGLKLHHHGRHHHRHGRHA
jgi:hypothetical protein